MRNLIRIALGASVAAFAFVGHQTPVNAQNAIQALVTNTCGTPTITLTQGKNGPVFQDTTGKLCTSGSGGGSGGAVFGPTAAGTAAANPPVLIGGTVDGTATGAVDNLKVSGGLAFINCANCTGSGASAADEAAFVAGTSLLAPSGGFFQTTATNNPLTTGQQGLAQMTSTRAFFVNVRNASGAELGLTAAPFITAGAGVAGTPAGGVMSIQGVASGTAVPVSGTFFQTTQPVSIASAQVASGAYASGSLASGAVVDLTNLSAPIAPNTATATKSLVIGGQFNTTQETLTNGQQGQVALSSRGAVFVATGADTFAVNATLQASSATAIGTVNPTTIGNWGLAASTQNGTTPTNMMLMAGQFNTSPTTITTGNVSPFQLDNAGRLIVNVGAGGGSGGTSSTFGATFPGTGTAAGMSQGGNMVALTGTSGSLNVNITGGAGSGGTALADAATFTAGTTQLTPIGGQFTSGGATACVTAHSCMSAITADRAMFANIADIAGTATLTGNGTTGAGSQRVTIASDNTAFSVNATLQASATTAIGKVDPNTIATWGLVAVGGAAAPTNALVGGAIYNSSPITVTTTQAAALQSDINGYLKVNVQSAVGLAQGSTTSGQTGSLVMGAVTTSAPTYTTAQTSPLSLDTAGNLRVNVVTGGSGGGAVFGPTAVGSAAANPPVLFAGTANAGATGNVQVTKVTSGGVLSTDLSTVNAVTTLTGTGAVGTGAQRIAVGTDTATIAGSAPGTAGTASPNVVTVQGVASMIKLLVTPDSVALPANQSVNVAQFGGVSTSTGQVAVSTAPVTATNTALVVDLRPDSPGIIALGGATPANSVPTVGAGFTYTHIATATTTTVKSGAGVLHIINVGSLGTVASTATIYDNTAGSGTIIGILNTLTLSGPFAYDVAFSTGLTLVTTGTVAPDITVSWR